MVCRRSDSWGSAIRRRPLARYVAALEVGHVGLGIAVELGGAEKLSAVPRWMDADHALLPLLLRP